MPLTSQQLEQYAEDGFLICRLSSRPPSCSRSRTSRRPGGPARRAVVCGRKDPRQARGGRLRERRALLEREFAGAAVLIHTGGILGPALARLGRRRLSTSWSRSSDRR